VAVKALSGKADTSVVEIVATPYLPIAVAGGIAAFFASARSLQLGPAVPVIAVTSIAGNASAILPGSSCSAPAGKRRRGGRRPVARVRAGGRRRGADPRADPGGRRCPRSGTQSRRPTGTAPRDGGVSP
jgi:hypothetical protein